MRITVINIFYLYIHIFQVQIVDLQLASLYIYKDRY